jgi:hypothetical protein
MSYASMDDLLELAAGIMQLDAAEASLGKGREWKQAKKQYEAAVEEFNSKRNDYVDTLLVKGEDWSAVPDGITEELDRIEAGADASWYPAIQYTRENLLPFLTKEAGRKPIVRDVIKWTPTALGVAAAVAYFGIRLTSGVEITVPIESKMGIQQRAAAAEKVIRYDDWMGTHVRRGRWLKGIMLWPIEPGEAEIKGAGEFVSLALDGYDVLAQKGQICGSLIGGYDNKLSKEQISFIDDIAEDLQQDGIQWQTPPVLTVLEPIKAKFPCK